MKFIKEYKLFESDYFKSNIDNIKAKINDIFLPRYIIRVTELEFEDSIILDIFSGAAKWGAIPFDCRSIDFYHRLCDLEALGTNFQYTAFFAEPTGNVYAMRFNSMEDLLNRRGGLVSNIKVTFSIGSEECSNPECDNILGNDEKECPVCGEKR